MRTTATPFARPVVARRGVRVPGVDEVKVIAALEDEVSRIKSILDAGPEAGADPQTFAFYSEGQLYGLEFALRKIREEPG